MPSLESVRPEKNIDKTYDIYIYLYIYLYIYIYMSYVLSMFFSGLGSLQ